TAVLRALDPSNTNKYFLFASNPLSITEFNKSLQTSLFSLSPSLNPKIIFCRLSVIPIATISNCPPNSIPSIITDKKWYFDKSLELISSNDFFDPFLKTLDTEDLLKPTPPETSSISLL